MANDRFWINVYTKFRFNIRVVPVSRKEDDRIPSTRVLLHTSYSSYELATFLAQRKKGRERERERERV